MKIWVLIGVCLGLFATAAMAQQLMSGDEIKAFVNGKNIEFSDGIATYKADGKYEYWLREGGRTFRGKWSIQGDRVCADFEDGRNRCDQYVKDGSKISIKTSRGNVLPVIAVK